MGYAGEPGDYERELVGYAGEPEEHEGEQGTAIKLVLHSKPHHR